MGIAVVPAQLFGQPKADFHTAPDRYDPFRYLGLFHRRMWRLCRCVGIFSYLLTFKMVSYQILNIL